jgi:hypothetical protein
MEKHAIFQQLNDINEREKKKSAINSEFRE